MDRNNSADNVTGYNNASTEPGSETHDVEEITLRIASLSLRYSFGKRSNLRLATSANHYYVAMSQPSRTTEPAVESRRTEPIGHLITTTNFTVSSPEAQFWNSLSVWYQPLRASATHKGKICEKRMETPTPKPRHSSNNTA